MVVPAEQSSVKVVNEYLLRVKNVVDHLVPKRLLLKKGKWRSWSFLKIMLNYKPTLLESPEELMVPKQTQVLEEIETLEEVWKHKNREKSINFTYTKEIWNHNEININNVFSFLIATEITMLLSLKLSMNVDKDMIGHNGKK